MTTDYDRGVRNGKIVASATMYGMIWRYMEDHGETPELLDFRNVIYDYYLKNKKP